MHFNWNISWSLSIALLSSIIRLSQIPFYYAIKNINFDNFTPQIILKWKQKLFVQDFMVDTKKYNLKQFQVKDMIKSYETNYLFSWLYQVIYKIMF